MAAGAGGPITVRVQLEAPLDNGGRIRYYAAAPPESRGSFSGSGLPFMNFNQAMHASPNVGAIEDSPTGNEVQVTLAAMPNAYYAGLGTVYVPPTLYLEYSSGGQVRLQSVRLAGAAAAYRTLTYPAFGDTKARTDATFYEPAPGVPVRTQEAILRASAYPSDGRTQEPNFWGTRPPM